MNARYVAYDRAMKRTSIITLAAAAAVLLAAGPATAAPKQTNPLDGAAYAFRCGYLKDVGSSFLDPSCQRPWEHLDSWDAGDYYSLSACEQAGRIALTRNGHARSYRCAPSGGQYTLTLRK